jgi:hypothetical protein
MFRPLIGAALLAAVSIPAIAQQPGSSSPPSQSLGGSSVYASYDWLVGDWYGKGGPGVLRENITYGPGRGYIKFSIFTAASESGPQHLHFEGIAVWNAKTRMLDYLFAVEPGSGVQENGTFRAEADNSIVREVQLIDPKGNVGTFRQTFTRTGQDSAVTTLFRKAETGWVPTFPGSEKIELTRRPG